MTRDELDRPPAEPETDPVGRTFQLGVWLFLASLGTLIGASLVAYVVIRLRAPKWPPANYPGPPNGLWIATALLLLASLSIHRSLGAIRKNDRPALRNGLFLTLGLLVAFLVVQIVNGADLLRSVGAGRTRDLFAFTFLLLVGLHGLHILGGLVPLGVTTIRAVRGKYDRGHHDGVWGVSVYIHFLDGVWLVMFVLLLV